ncbi:MAG TPA: AraC family transcriptional regulator ligand-binding domain-containing protein [Polyangiaceae bacterium]|nr:AraC family transcriptional regulator ligand-binding domain-containing protein [Polyangiaceae bacterium]
MTSVTAPAFTEEVNDPTEGASGKNILIRSQSLPLFFEYIHKVGGHGIEAAVRRRFPIPDVTGTLVKEMTVSLATYRAASQFAANLIGDEYVGLHAAQAAPRGSLGILEFAARNAHNVDETLQWTVRYASLVSEVCKIEVERSRGEFALMYYIPDDPLGLGRQGNEFSLAVFHRFLNEATRSSIRAISVEFGHPEPRDVSALVEFFGTTNLVFAEEQQGHTRGRNRIAFDEAALLLPIVSRDEKLVQWVDTQATTPLPPEPDGAHVVPGLELHIRQCLQDGAPPTVAEIAQRLRISARTLQRRLGDAGMSFYGVLESVRKELVESYLRDSRLSIHEVALRLGYANERGFERAFTRWHEKTPRAYRRELASIHRDEPSPPIPESGVSVSTTPDGILPEPCANDTDSAVGHV